MRRRWTREDMDRLQKSETLAWMLPASSWTLDLVVGEGPRLVASFPASSAPPDRGAVDVAALMAAIGAEPDGAYVHEWTPDGAHLLSPKSR